MSELTDRGRDVLARMAQGRTNSAIADALHVSVSSIEKYSSFAKLGLLEEPDVHRRVAAVLAYLDRGRARPLSRTRRCRSKCSGPRPRHRDRGSRPVAEGSPCRRARPRSQTLRWSPLAGRRRVLRSEGR